MLPDVSDVLSEWSQTVTLKTVTKTTVDFQPVIDVTTEAIKAVVQVARPETLNVGDIDWSLRYLRVHSTSQIDVGQYIEYQGINYKVITPSNWQDYGYSEVIAEEVKGELK